jgi:protein SCO1/2
MVKARFGMRLATGSTPGVRSCVSFLALALLALATAVLAHPIDPDEERLPHIGPAADFSLDTVEGGRLGLRDLRGKVVAVTFIYTTCTDTCPLLTAKLSGIARRLSPQFASEVFFVAITVDPERDTPAALKRYARTYGATGPGWAFLTGTPARIAEVARRYGVVFSRQGNGDVSHTFLTSIIDQEGILRVQYMGVRFDPEEFLTDLRALLHEAEFR